MLVLSRSLARDRDAILLELPGGETVRIILLDIRTLHQVKLGIEAPPSVRIVREEIAVPAS